MGHAMPPIALYAVLSQTRQAFWISYATWCVMEIWIFARDRRPASGRRMDRGSVFLNIALITAGNTLAFMAPFLWPQARIALPAMPLFETAIALIWAGMALRLWAVFTLGRQFRSTVRILDDHELVTKGPYRMLRHPSYSGDLLAVTGIGLAMGNWLSAGCIFGCTFVAYFVRILVEEWALRGRFGETYKAYCRRTWAVIPPVW